MRSPIIPRLCAGNQNWSEWIEQNRVLPHEGSVYYATSSFFSDYMLSVNGLGNWLERNSGTSEY